MEWSDDDIHRQLAELYYAPGDPGSLGGIERLYRRAREVGIPADHDQVRNFLRDQLTYQLHKPVRHHFKRNQTVAGRRDEQWQADLADMTKISKENDGYQYILTVVDVLSRYAWAIPVKSKSAQHVLQAMRKLFKVAAPRKPTRLQTDKGREFYNALVRKFLEEHDVELFSTQSDQKAALAERFNRTIKTRIWNRFTAQRNQRWVDIVGDIVYAYNHSYHRTIGRRPVDVQTEEDDAVVWRRVYYDSPEAQEARRVDRLRDDPLDPVNSRVRLSRWKGNFEKGYMPNWGREYYNVVEEVKRSRGGHPRPVYKLEDTQGEEIEGVCYPEELQLVPDRAAQVYEIDKVLRKRKDRDTGAQETLVRFKGWSDKFNRWLTDEELAQYKQSPREQQRLVVAQRSATQS